MGAEDDPRLEDSKESQAAVAPEEPLATVDLREDDSEEGPAKRARVLSVAINDLRTLRAAYMPFVKGTGLFVPTNTDYKMGDEIFVVLKLLADEQFALSGVVIWITPPAAQSSRTRGVGIHFKGDEAVRLKDRIVELLGDSTHALIATHTL